MKNKNLAVFITVRTGSTRLKNKSLLKIGDKYTIEYVIERAKKSKLANNVILCTTSLEKDEVLCDIAKKHEINFFKGSIEDKLDRWNAACEKFKIDFFVTADGDDLFCEPLLIDLALDQYTKDKKIEFIKCDDILCGAFTYGIKATALKKVCEIKDSKSTEMMWVYFTNSGFFNVANLANVKKAYLRPDIRMTLDYFEDYLFFKRIVEHFEDAGIRQFNLDDIIQFVDCNPEVKMINFGRHKEWSDNQKSKTEMRLK